MALRTQPPQRCELSIAPLGPLPPPKHPRNQKALVSVRPLQIPVVATRQTISSVVYSVRQRRASNTHHVTMKTLARVAAVLAFLFCLFGGLWILFNVGFKSKDDAVW